METGYAENLKESRRNVLIKKMIMKKFRMMLPVLAVVFAVVAAVGGDFLPTSEGYYKISSNQCSAKLTLDYENCFVTSDPLPICTITVGSAQQAYENSNCTGVLRRNP